MATKLTGIGEITTNFILSDWTCYIQNTSSTGGYVTSDWAILGYTDAEKNITRNNEKYEKEGKIPRVKIWTKTIRKGMEITAGLSNFNEKFESIIIQGVWEDLGSGTGQQIKVGTTESTLEHRTVMFSADMENGKTYNIIIPKCIIRQDGDQTGGGEEETRWPLRFVATYNPAAAANQNLYYDVYLTAGLNATAITPIGFS